MNAGRHNAFSVVQLCANVSCHLNAQGSQHAAAEPVVRHNVQFERVLRAI